MNVEPVGFLPPSLDVASAAPAEAAGPADFARWVAKEIGATSEKIVQSDRMLQRLAAGEVDNLHQVMVSLEEARLSFQLLVQVRNRLLEAYQDVMKMQV